MNDKFTSWVSAMGKSDQTITIGNNPILPSIIRQTWGWPSVFIEFYLDQHLIALVSFVKVRNTWVSLPHFDHDSMWINHSFLVGLPSFNQSFGQYQEEIAYRLFYGLSSKVLVAYGDKNSFGHGMVIHVRTEANDLNQINQFDLANQKVKLISRNQYPVLKHKDFSKVIPTMLLKEDYDIQFAKFNARVRRKIRKAGSNGITVKSGGVEFIDIFYGVYRKNIRQLGSFGLPKSFFQNLIGGYQFGFAKVLIAELDQKPAGAAILLNFGSHAENGWFASLQDYNKHYVTYALHEAMIRYAIEKNCRIYSFGRSTDQSSGHHYKKQWGTSDIPLVLSSNQKLTIRTEKYKFVSGILKNLPDKLLNPLDALISKIIY